MAVMTPCFLKPTIRRLTNYVCKLFMCLTEDSPVEVVFNLPNSQTPFSIDSLNNHKRFILFKSPLYTLQPIEYSTPISSYNP